MGKQWMVAAAKCDYTTLFKMLRDDPRLAKAKDFTSGYTALHWACKHGNLDLVKLLAGQYGANTNIRSHGGYTPLHLACQFDHQEVFDILVKAYGADPNLRDYAGKKARQYMATIGHGLHNMSNDTFRQLKDRRKNRSRQLADKNSGPSGILRFGSLSVKVKKTTEAFNNYFNHSNPSPPNPKKCLHPNLHLSKNGNPNDQWTTNRVLLSVVHLKIPLKKRNLIRMENMDSILSGVQLRRLIEFDNFFCIF